MSAELSRKALHLLSLLIPTGLIIFGPRVTLMVLAPMTAAALIIEILRTRSNTVRDLVGRIFGFMMRPEEIPPVPAPIRFNGATWVLLTSTIIVALFEPEVAAAAIAIGLIGDAAAAIVGRTIGRVSIGTSGKTVEGSLAFCLVSLPVIWVVPGITLLAGGLGILAAALVEAFRIPMNDNFTVPLAAAIVMTLLLA